jgi:hypothetical protein
VDEQHNLLVVDWDYFFPNPLEGGEYKDRGSEVWLYDWQHAEAPLYIDQLWETRGQAFLLNGLELPRCEGYDGFWQRFTIAPDTPLFVADSNRHAGLMRPEDGGFPFYDSVWLYDAHHDCGYKVRSLEEFAERPTFDCEDWMLIHAARDTELHVRYPQWKVHVFNADGPPAIEVDRQFDNGETPPVTFTDVFVCRSGAWVPSWNDDQFAEFVESYPGDQMDFPTDDPTPMLQRPFNREEVETIADAHRTLVRQWTGQS